MASGKLGSEDLSATTDTLIFTAAVNQLFNVRCANRNAGSIAYRLAIGTGASPADKDYINYDIEVPGAAICEDTALVLSAGEKVWARSDIANVSIRAYGMPSVNGVLGSADLVAATPTLLFTATQDLTCNIRFANRTPAEAAFRVAIGTGGSAVNKDYISYDVPIPPKGIGEDLGIFLASGEKLWVVSNLSSVSVRAHAM